MEDLSRRVFVRRAGLGALAVGLVAGTPAVVHAATGSADQAGSVTPAAALAVADGPVMAHVVDASSGLVHVFVGTRMVAVTDHGLARTLAGIAAS
jgi:hypothetical protein